MVLSLPSSVPCSQAHAAAQELWGDAALLGWVCRGQIAQGTAQGDDDARRICLLEPTLKLSSRAIRAAGGSCLLQGCPGTAPSSSSPTPSSTCPTHISSPWCPTALSCPSRRILAAQRMQLSLCISSFASLPLHLSLCSSLFATLPFASLPPAALPLQLSLCISPFAALPFASLLHFAATGHPGLISLHPFLGCMEAKPSRDGSPTSLPLCCNGDGVKCWEMLG